MHPLVSETNFDTAKRARLAEKRAKNAEPEPPPVSLGGLAGVSAVAGKVQNKLLGKLAQVRARGLAKAKLPPMRRYAPGEFEEKAEEVKASVDSTLKAISTWDPTTASGVREAKKGKHVEEDDPEAEALKRRLYRYKYVRRIDDKLPTINQLRERIQQQEEDEKEESDLASPRSA